MQSPIHKLNQDTIYDIFQYLDWSDILYFGQSNQHFNTIGNNYIQHKHNVSFELSIFQNIHYIISHNSDIENLTINIPFHSITIHNQPPDIYCSTIENRPIILNNYIEQIQQNITKVIKFINNNTHKKLYNLKITYIIQMTPTLFTYMTNFNLPSFNIMFEQMFQHLKYFNLSVNIDLNNMDYIANIIFNFYK